MKIRYLALSLMLTANLVNAATMEELAELTEANADYMKLVEQKKEFVSALERNAQRVGYNHGYKSVMDDFKKSISIKEQHWNEMLTFQRITSLVQDGVAKGMYLKGGIVDEIDSGVELVDKNVIYANDKSYVIKQYPELVIRQPHWRDYLFKKEKYELDLPDSSLLPRNEIEKQVWKTNIEVGWKRGENSAYQEIYNRWKELFADLRGMTRYWTLVELGKIKDAKLGITTAPITHEAKDGYEKLTLNPSVIKIDAQATFNKNISGWNAVETRPNQDARSSLRDAIISGDHAIDDISDAQIIITTPEFESDYDSIPNTNPYK